MQLKHYLKINSRTVIFKTLFFKTLKNCLKQFTLKKELREAKKLTGQGQVIGDEGLDFFLKKREG
jgi:hypothetical protein